MGEHSTAKDSPFLSLSGITKSFGGVAALSGVSLEVSSGQIHALVGENGAGKSTLVKIMIGLYPHGSFQGEFRFEGKACHFTRIADSQKLGINMVFQELSLVPSLSIAENMFLGAEIKGPFGTIHKHQSFVKSKEILKQLNIDLDPNTLVKSLGVGQQQMVEIGKALHKQTKILILDEPTAGLSTLEAESLIDRLKHLRSQGIAIIYISHRLHEVMRLADRITVLRDGQSVATGLTNEFTEDTLISHMVGRSLTQRFPPRKMTPTSMQLSQSEEKEDILSVQNWDVVSPSTGKSILTDITFSLKKGEILGIFGLMGSGRTELALSLFGLMEPKRSQKRLESTLHIDHQKVWNHSAQDAISKGLALVSEDRKQTGLLLDRSVGDNLTLAHLDFFGHHGVVNQELQSQVAQNLIDRLGIKPPQATLAVKNLSGGNQQKVCLGKWLVRTPKVLILDEPTRGVDVGAKYEIYSIMRDLAAQGVGVLMISSDLEEMIGMSDRVMVLAKGKIAAFVEKTDLAQTPELLMTYAVGL